MTLQLKEGMICVTRDGKKTSPIRGRDGSADGYWFVGRIEGAPSDDVWRRNGTFHCAEESCAKHDLVAEWVDEPVLPVRTRTRTVTEIVPGTYGRVYVWESNATVARVLLTRGNGMVIADDAIHDLTAAELRAAARVFVSLAEALEEQSP
jgi:hypothetical protein